MARLDSLLRSPEMKTPGKSPNPSRPRVSKFCATTENSDSNLPGRSPSWKPVTSPVAKSATARKSARKTPIRVASSPPVVQERKFIVARRNNVRWGEKDRDPKKCQKEAYDALRASQEDFFKRDREATDAEVVETAPVEEGKPRGGEEPHNNRCLQDDDLEGSSKLRKIRSLMMEEAVSSMPEPGAGRVMHLVKAFESLLSVSKEAGCDQVEESKKNVMNWALPGLQPPPRVSQMEASSSSVASSEVFFFPSRGFERDSTVYSACDDSDGRLSFRGTESGEGRSRRNSSDSLRGSWNKKLRVTSGQHPFKLRTEERGMLKQENFLKRVREMLMEEERKRLPIAQGIPWTTDEPECLVKPPVKETTEPVDIVLHSDVRAVERAAFDHYVAERMTVIEQIKLERERRRKLEEEEEIRELRKEMVPKAQPMPYFDRPFLPKKSMRPRTVLKEPSFHVHPRKACYKGFADLIKRADETPVMKLL